MTHLIRFTERTLASVRCECACGWKAEVLTAIPNRQRVLNAEVAQHFTAPALSAGHEQPPSHSPDSQRGGA